MLTIAREAREHFLISLVPSQSGFVQILPIYFRSVVREFRQADEQVIFSWRGDSND